MTINKVTRTILIDENTDKKIREHRANAIKFSTHQISYSEIVNLLVAMTIADDEKMENIDNYFVRQIERKSR